MDYPVLAGCGLTRSDAAKVLPPVLLVCQRGCKRSANPLHRHLVMVLRRTSSSSSLSRPLPTPDMSSFIPSFTFFPKETMPSALRFIGSLLSLSNHSEILIENSTSTSQTFTCPFTCHYPFPTTTQILFDLPPFAHLPTIPRQATFVQRATSIKHNRQRERYIFANAQCPSNVSICFVTRLLLILFISSFMPAYIFSPKAKEFILAAYLSST